MQTLTTLFPIATVPNIPSEAERIELTKKDDIDLFLSDIRSDIAFAPFRRGAGPGGATAELWAFTAK